MPRGGLGYGDAMRRDRVETYRALIGAPLTYPEVGATRAEVLPAGYGHVQRDVSVGTGSEVFERAAAALSSWRMHQDAGLSVIYSGGSAASGVVVVLGAGWGPLRLRIPCRVVYTIDEADCRGFAYGTLPGHPESGEEAFMITAGDTGEVRIGIRAFSRPASLVARVGGPISRMAQQYVTDRYVSAIRRLSQG
jgi:uncharacterized protein (UPF0548 family)